MINFFILEHFSVSLRIELHQVDNALELAVHLSMVKVDPNLSKIFFPLDEPESAVLRLFLN